MWGMSDINDIRDLSKKGYRISDIHSITKRDPKTIKKYLEKEDFSETPPISKKNQSILDPYKETISGWLDEDRKHWKKQHHTARRVYDRLVSEEAYTGSYETVQRYVKIIRKDIQNKATQELIWEPGNAEVDFGEADFNVNGKCLRRKYLVVSFPYSNDGYAQVFGGETAECVCQGLQDIFRYIEGVPETLIFDNATGVGRRVGETVTVTELFKRFRAHYGFQIKFCNPRSGWEKGSVENKVGTVRRNLFVPVRSYNDIIEFNKGLLDEHIRKADELHYKKGVLIKELFRDDVKHFAPLPSKEFNVCRYEWFKADGYGKICIEGKHYYSTRPENHGKNVMAGIMSHYIDIINDDGTVLVRHARQYGDVRTDISDYSTTLEVLVRNAGAFGNSGIRKDMPDPLREYMDGLEKHELKTTLSLLSELNNTYGYETSLEAMSRSLRGDHLSGSDVRVVAERISSYGADTPPTPGPDLSCYDRAFRAGEEGACSC